MNPVFSPKSDGAVTMGSSLTNNMQGNISEKLSKSVPVSKYSKVSPGVSVHSRNQWKMTKRDQKMHKLVFEEGGLPEGTEVAYYSRGKKLLVGYKKGSGIFCSCCNTEVSPSQFEAHAGWASRKKPYGYIYTSNGVSLHEFAISLLKGRKSSLKDSDDLCIICADGGKLVLCDGCPRAFHKEQIMGNRITGAQDLADPRMSHAYGGTSQGFGGTSRSTLRSSWEMALIFDSGRIYGWGPRALRDEFPTLPCSRRNTTNNAEVDYASSECASLSTIPRGKWYCKYCESMLQREKFAEHNANALAAGRVSGVDSIEQITNRCIRSVKNAEEAEFIACVLCRAYDFSKSGFGPRTVILCDQCEKEYHVGCLKKSKISDLKELPKGKWFCSTNCKRIYSALQNLLNSGEERLPDSCLDATRVKEKEKSLVAGGEFDVRWRLLSGRVSSRETRRLLAEAVSIFHDGFDPIVDSVTGRDFIPSMVYGRNIRGQDFGGMYCAILTVNSTVVSAGILRIFGQDMAELPLVATRVGSKGKGYFQVLFSCIEKLLAFLGVRRFVLPAAVEAMSIWTKKFGFVELTPDQIANYRKTCWQMISFKGTSMLEKMVPKCRIIQRGEAEAEADVPDE
ncbi:putative UDP-glycosyltransferase 73C4-like [Capsicum annuum]|nr:putative UDP-glycosyltransferase 73C4-like [Capsicum annuum]